MRQRPRLYADVDRAKADMLGVEPSEVFEALQVYLGSAYVNDFNLLGRTYRVTAQADRSATIPRTSPSSRPAPPRGDGPDRLDRDLEDRDRSLPRHRYNLFPAVEMDGEPPRLLDRQAMAQMEKIAQSLGRRLRDEWTDIAFQQKAAGNTAGIVFGLAVVFVFLVLAAQFES